MARVAKLASVASLAFATATTDAQQAPAPVADSIAGAGYRDGRAAAATRGTGRYAALGAVTGFIAVAALSQGDF
jgi:hypothetical protein